PAGTLLGDQPALPIFSAIPTQQALQEHWWLLLLLLLAGIVAGWWFFSTGENHLEDFVVGKIPHQPTAITVGVLLTGVCIGVSAGVLCLGIMAISGGSWAIGTLTTIGAPPLLAAGLFAA